MNPVVIGVLIGLFGIGMNLLGFSFGRWWERVDQVGRSAVSETVAQEDE